MQMEVKQFQQVSVEEYAVNNIYDMAGNVLDRTIEASSTSFRVFHGGDYYFDNGSSYPASGRSVSTPTYSSYGYGSRLALYM